MASLLARGSRESGRRLHSWVGNYAFKIHPKLVASCLRSRGQIPGVGLSFWIWTWWSALAMGTMKMSLQWKENERCRMLPLTPSGSIFFLQAAPKENAWLQWLQLQPEWGSHTMRLLLCLAKLGNREGARFDPISCQVFMQLLKWGGPKPQPKFSTPL